MTTTPLRVAIIGAGPGGLCLAQGLQQPGIAVQVYERDAAPDQHRQGYRLRIDHNGQTALQRCLTPVLYERFRRGCALAGGDVRTFDTRLEPQPGKWVDDWRDARRADLPPDLCADRRTLREVLLSGLEDQVQVGKCLHHYEDRGAQGVILHFEDGSTAHADVLVGADGVHSRVRAQRFAAAVPTDTGDVCCYGKTVLDATARSTIATPLQSGTSVIFEQGLALVVDAMRFDTDVPAGAREIDDYLYWALIGRRARFGITDDDPLRWSEATLRTHIGGLIAAWSAPLRALFELASPGAVTLLPVRTAPALTPWPASRITLLGDAIHVMSPASGLGANSALFDAAVLAQTLREAAIGSQPLLDAVANYEAQMRAHSFANVQASQQGGRQLYAAQTEHATKEVNPCS